jgi:CRISPR-associated protein Cas2
MSRSRYLVTYDVADDDRRTAVFRALNGVGDHAQYSVFLCDLNDREFVDIRRRLHELIHEREDQVLLVDLGPCETADQRIASLGIDYQPPQRLVVV